MTIINTLKVNDGKPLRFWFDIDQQREAVEITAGSSTSFTEDDKEGTRFFTSSTGERVTLIPLVVYALSNEQISFTFESDNPAEIQVNETGSVVYQVPSEQTASATITVTGSQGSYSVIRTLSVTLTVSGPSTIDLIEGGVEGSARKALSDVIDNALSGANPDTQKKIFTSQDHSTPAYVRNTSFFLNSHVEALTCASPWNSDSGKKKAGTAITKRHAVLAHHYKYGAGTTVRFVTSDNTVVTRTVVQASRIIYNSQETDALMVLFDSDLPDTITPCKLFPSSFSDYLPAGIAENSYAATDIPLLALDYEEKGFALDFLAEGATPTMTVTYPLIQFSEPSLADRLSFYEAPIVGDSGNPIFAAIGSELWLLSTFFGAGAGPFYGGLITELNAMITTLDTLQGDLTGYTVTEGDLSSYTDYS